MFGIDDAALAMILSGAISTAGQIYTNNKNRDYQREANALNWEIAKQNNATQIEMANTAHQREVRDLRAAHLNPILSAGGSGATVPQLHAPNVEPVHVDNAFNGLANSAKGVSRFLSQEYKNQLLAQEADRKLTQAQAELSRTSDTLQSREIDRMVMEMQERAETRPLRMSNVRKEAENDFLRSHLESKAMEFEYGIKPRYNQVGDLVGVNPVDWEKYANAVHLAGEGLRSDLKVRANSNWRANLSSFVPFTSPAAINSGTSSARTLQKMIRK